jgi:hypothetical protein
MVECLSPRDAARAIGGSESSPKRWGDDSLLRATRTVGGHRRIAVQEVVRFARTRRVVVQPPNLLVGGAPAGDPSRLPSLMAATVLAEVGWRDVNVGADVPIEVFARAIDEYRPALVWVSATVRDDGGGARLLRALAELGSARRLPIVVGGQATNAPLVAGRPGIHHLGSMAELAGFARALLARAGEAGRR